MKKHLFSKLLAAVCLTSLTFAAYAADTPAKSGTKSTETAPGGGADKVWASGSKTYHCVGSRFYGKTKNGEYMSEADAKAKGLHPARNKPCSS